MFRRPGEVEQLVLDWGTTGIASDIGVRVLDNEGATTIARTTGFLEYPAGSGVYYLADFEFPDERGTYTLLYDVDAGVAAPGFTATEDLEITSTAGEPFTGDVYGSTDELFRILKIRNPTSEQEVAAERVLAAATGEIDAEIDRADDDPIAGWEISMVTEVALERAVEHWRQEESPFGLYGVEGLEGLAPTARNSWERHALKLAPLKRQFGLA